MVAGCITTYVMFDNVSLDIVPILSRLNGLNDEGAVVAVIIW
jgi:hypothetical protein